MLAVFKPGPGVTPVSAPQPDSATAAGRGARHRLSHARLARFGWHGQCLCGVIRGGCRSGAERRIETLGVVRVLNDERTEES